MYKIIGADGQQYGPVNLEQLRGWIAGGRARAETLVQVEGAQEWKPLGLFPELASELKSTPPPAAAIPPTITPLSPAQASRASVKIPAGVCGILLGSFGVHKFILGYTGAGLVMLLVTLLTCFIASPLMHIIGLIEGIIYLCKPDDDFVRTYVDGRKSWF
jgi:TM2 domain-containing membrane protein YozV